MCTDKIMSQLKKNQRGYGDELQEKYREKNCTKVSC